VKDIAVLVLVFALAGASAPAVAQDLTAGKTPAQLFRSDCSECHRSPNGLARIRDVRLLADFLREHYTTKSETAGALAAYVVGFPAVGSTARNRGTGVTAPASIERPQAERRPRGQLETTMDGEDVSPGAKLLDGPAGRPRRTTSLSGEAEKRSARTDGEVPRPPANIANSPAAPKPNTRVRNSPPREAIDPISRLRLYLSSGLGSEGASSEAAKTGAPKARKRRNRADNAEPLPPLELQAASKATETPASAASPGIATAPSMTDTDASEKPAEETGASAPATTVAPEVTQQHLEQ
jgi:hypothetical protein